MKQTIRAFAIGLFTAALIMLVINYFTSSSKEDFSEMPIEDVVNELKEQGYRVLTETEYISLSMDGEVNKKETEVASETEEVSDKDESDDNKSSTEESTDNQSEESSANQTEQQEPTAKSYTLTIEAGMPSSTISNQLESNGIIDSSSEFISYLEDEGYANRIQLGQFTLSSDMSYFEIAEALTK
ncbi:hypothetical protein [Ornithinibacillus sp. 179-J 7C1 HS]|uniref:hypothetical protein n=1 Tax=Ornithinibacillus sp. 179-J 7C1 HS TaxID=3142384 RepID=UPI00399F0453